MHRARAWAPFIYLVVVCAPVVAEALLALGPWSIRPSIATWLTIALLVVGTIGVAIHPVDRSRFLAGTLGLACAVLILSGALLGAIVTAVVLVAAYGVGSVIVRATAPAVAPAELALYAAAIGLGVTSYATLAVALLGVLVPWLVILLLVAGFVIARRELVAAAVIARGALHRLPRGRTSPLLVAGCVWGLVILIEAVAPEVQYDALSYHLGLPRVWIDAGRLIDVPEQTQSYYYLGAEMNFALAMLLGGQAAAKLISFAYLGLAVLAVYILARRTFSARAAIIAVALFVTTPAVAWQGSTTYVDVAVTAYITLGVVAILSVRRDKSVPLVLIAGALCGLAVATKLTALLAVVPAAVLVVAIGAPGWRAQRSLAFAATAVLAVAPWPILRYVQTGNPVFPLLNAFFQSPLWPAVNTRFALGDFGVGTDVAGLAQLPLAFTYLGQRFDDGAVGAAFGVGLLLLPLAIVFHRRSADARALALFAVATFVAWAVSAQYARYVLPIVGTFSVLAAAALEPLSRSGTRLVRAAANALPAVLAVSSFPLLLFLYAQVPGRIPYAVALGIESPDAYLTRTLPTYAPLQTLGPLGGAGSNVLIASYRAGAADDEDRLYAPGRVLTNSSLDAQRLYAMTDARLAVAWLAEHGITHILVDRQGISAAMRDAAVLQPAFLERFGTRLYLRDTVELYRLDLP